MTSAETQSTPDVKEALVETATPRRRATIGLPKCLNHAEKRFPLTPEAVGTLTRMGFAVRMEADAASYIHYSDRAYVRAGAQICPRSQALGADIVIHLAPLEISDIRQLHRGAMLLSLANFNRKSAPEVIKELLSRRIINIAIDLVRDPQGNRPFGDILSEIDGRSAMTIAASMLADPVNGKGILLGGIAGVIPCEVTIIGSCLAAAAAARSAMGLGAIVRLFDDDVYRLRTALRQLGGGVIGSSLHPRVLESALRTADIVVVTERTSALPVDGDPTAILKRNALVFDLSECPGRAFTSLRPIDLGELDTLKCTQATGFSMVNDLNDEATYRRYCFINPGSTVPRTAAMALSDTFITLLNQIADCEGGGAGARLPLSAGLQQAVLTFMGKAVNPKVASLAGLRYTDIAILLSLS